VESVPLPNGKSGAALRRSNYMPMPSPRWRPSSHEMPSPRTRPETCRALRRSNYMPMPSPRWRPSSHEMPSPRTRPETCRAEFPFDHWPPLDEGELAGLCLLRISSGLGSGDQGYYAPAADIGAPKLDLGSGRGGIGDVLKPRKRSSVIVSGGQLRTTIVESLDFSMFSEEKPWSNPPQKSALRMWC